MSSDVEKNYGMGTHWSYLIHVLAKDFGGQNCEFVY